MSSAHVEALEAILRSKRTPGDSAPKVALARLSTEIHNRLTHGNASSLDFFESSLRAITRIKGVAHAVMRMEALCNIAQYLYSYGRSQQALLAAAQCEELARRTGDDHWLSKAQNLLGVLHANLGNIGDAVILCAKALDSAQKRRDVVREVSVINCIGVAIEYGGLYRQAIPCFDRILSITSGAEFLREATKAGPVGREYRRSALTNKAQCHFYLDELSESFAAIAESLRDCEEPWDSLAAERRTLREFTYVFVALELGKLAAARQHAAECHRYSLRATDRARFYSGVAFALCEVHGGDAAIGLKKLEDALSSCRAAADRTGILKFLIRSYDQLGRSEAALSRLDELIIDLRAMRQAGLEAILSIMAPIGVSTSVRDGLDSLAIRAAVLRTKVLERRLASERVEMFERLAIAADLKEDESGRHGYRVGKLAASLAERLHWSPENVTSLELAARLHDVGKIALPDRILFASKELAVAERSFISTHATAGAEILSKSNLPQLRIAEEIARHHHERWDGTGYPAKLAGKCIPIHARIVALADVFDALTHGRPYAPAWSVGDALAEISSRRGSQFDPDLTDAFLEMIDNLCSAHPDLDGFLAEGSRNSPFLQARDKIRLMLQGERDADEIAAATAETVH